MGFVSRSILYSVLKYGSGLLRLIVHYFLKWLFTGKKRAVPRIENPILLLPATALAMHIREGKIPCEDAIKAYIERIKEVQPYINAITEDRFAEAIEDAKKVDQLISSKAKTSEALEKEKPLLGVPFSVKLLFGVKGMYCNAASKMFKDLKAHEDSEVVTAMKKAGAICIASTNIPEFALNFETRNLLYGTCSNPYDTTRTSGGSSGGEGALVASGGSVIGLGNDLGGSIRLPAHFNGIFGHKPTNGIVSNKGIFPLLPPKTDGYLCSGPMCRYADDLIVSMKALVGTKATELKLGQPVDFRTLKLYYMEHEDGNPLSPAIDADIRRAQQKVINYFKKEHGIIAKSVKLHGMQLAFRAYANVLLASNPKTMKDIMVGDKHHIIPKLELLKFFFGRTNFSISALACLNVESVPFLINRSKLSKFEKQLKVLNNQFEDILEENAVLLFPTFPKKAPYHGEISLSIPGTAYTAIFNILGFPITQCPIEIANDGLPVGIQVIGGKYQDFLTMATAVEIEKAFGGWIPPNHRVKGS